MFCYGRVGLVFIKVYYCVQINYERRIVFGEEFGIRKVKKVFKFVVDNVIMVLIDNLG